MRLIASLALERQLPDQKAAFDRTVDFTTFGNETLMKSDSFVESNNRKESLMSYEDFEEPPSPEITLGQRRLLSMKVNRPKNFVVPFES